MTETMILNIPALDCAAEEAEIRSALEPLTDIHSLTFQLAARTLTMTATPEAMPAILAAIRRAGFDAQPIATRESAPNVASSMAPAGFGDLVKPVSGLLLAALAEGLTFWSGESPVWNGAALACAAVAIVLAGFGTYRKGLSSLLRGRLNIAALMSTAVTGAFIIGQWPEAAMVMALYAIAELIEARSLDRARNAIRSLMKLAPTQADVKRADGTWNTVAAETVAVGTIVRIRPGERVALDGVVISGASAINQAPVTGESIPVDKSAGDSVFAGTINETGELEFRVTAASNDTTLARIIHAVETAEGTRAPTQRFVDRFAAVYTPAIFVLAVGVAALTPWLLGWPWLQALYKALVLLVIGCPCALVISTPVTIVSALARAARRGILIKGGTYLEQARQLQVVALDKTGTITEGRPRLVEQSMLGDLADATTYSIASALAGRSDHPVSKAIHQGLVPSTLIVEDFRAMPGRGVAGKLAGADYVLGNHRLIEERKQCSPSLEAILRTHEAAGRTVTLLASSSGVQALFAVADTIKDTSLKAILNLKTLGLIPVLLSGDNPQTAMAIAAEAGISEARGDLLPEDKVAAVEDLRQRHGMTAMVGDGINDSPALAKADIGIAMGGAGTDTAMEAADIVIMNDDLRRIAELVRLSRKAHVVLWQNISFALGIKAAFLLLALFNGATMWMAVFADMGASLLVVANGLRLLRSSPSSN